MSFGHTEFEFGRGEEIANAITHGLGLLMAVAALPVLVVLAVWKGTAWHVVSCSVYASTLVLLYTSSTFFHALPGERAKRVFGKLDYSAIYLLIAGTYTPFALVSLRGPWGWSLFGVVWGLAILGVLFELLMKRRRGWLSLAFYIALGWLLMIAIRPLLQAVPLGGLVLIAAGGVAYTLGSVFYVWRAFPYHHAVWHLFVLAGSVLHYLAVAFYVIPLHGGSVPGTA